VAGFVPLGDASRPLNRFAVVTTLIIVLNIWVFFQELTYGDPFVSAWSAVPIRIIHGRALITIVTSMFMHAGWMHIIGNMIYLWAFGREIENAMGPVRFAVFYLTGGIVAMSAQILGDPFSRIPSLGASGAIAAVMGAFIVTYPRDRIKSLLIIVIYIRVTMIPAALLIGVWFLIQLINAGSVANVQSGGVAYLAHVGGFIFGAVTVRWWRRHPTLAYDRAY
jgi:membrane associated rhomboid family serine protease